MRMPLRDAAGRAIIGVSLAASVASVWPSDRWVETALLAYIPPVLHVLGVVAALALLARDPARNARWVAAATLAIAFAAITLVHDHRVPHGPPAPAARVHRILHWNIEAHARMEELPRLAVDTICLNETVRGGAYKPDPSWHHVGTYGVAVVSRYALEMRRAWDGPGVQAIHVVVASDPPLSILLADVTASPWRPRRLALESLAGLIPELEPPPDVILGDFNTPAGCWSLRSAFRDRYVEAYRVAGAGSAYTWPWPLPVMRLDQIFVRRGLGIAGLRSGLSRSSDHAWQDVAIAVGR